MRSLHPAACPDDGRRPWRGFGHRRTRRRRTPRGAGARAASPPGRAVGHRGGSRRHAVVRAPAPLFERHRPRGDDRDHLRSPEGPRRPGVDPPGDRGVRQGARQPAAARTGVPRGAGAARSRHAGPSRVRPEGRWRRQGLSGLEPDHRAARSRRRSSAVGFGLGWSQHSGSGALQASQVPSPGGGRTTGRQAARLRHLRPGRHRPVAAHRVPEAVLHRQSRRLRALHVGRHQRRRRGYRQHHDQQRMAGAEHPAGRTARSGQFIPMWRTAWKAIPRPGWP